MPAPATRKAGTTGGRALIHSLTLTVALAASLAACSPTGDFGRPRPGLGEHLTTTASRIAARLPDPDVLAHAPAFRTAVEQEARDRLVHFDRPVASLPQASASARFNALTDRIAEDRALLPLIAALHPAVAARDAIRAGAVAGLRTLPPAAADDADAVAADNRAMVTRLCRRVRERADVYRRLLERAVVRAPENEAVAAERALIRLETEGRAVCERSTSPGLPRRGHQSDGQRATFPVLKD